jgi:hypothetical protein
MRLTAELPEQAAASLYPRFRVPRPFRLVEAVTTEESSWRRKRDLRWHVRPVMQERERTVALSRVIAALPEPIRPSQDIRSGFA